MLVHIINLKSSLYLNVTKQAPISGLVHTQAGYLTYAGFTHQHVFDYQAGDVYGCVADVGWITGHSYVVYGPLSNGATTVMFESTPTYPDPGERAGYLVNVKIVTNICNSDVSPF